MDKLLKSKSGVAAILVIIILVVAVGAGGATVLAVRMVVTGEDYLQPFVDLGLISEDVVNDDKEETEGTEETVATAGRLIELSSEATAKGVTHYVIGFDTELLVEAGLTMYNSMLNTMSSYSGSTVTDYSDELEEVLELEKDMEFVIDIYADGNDLIEVVMYINYGETLEAFYDYAVENELEGIEDYTDYEDFLKDFYDELEDEGLDKDGLVEACVELFDEYDIDITESEIKKMTIFELDKDAGAIEIGFEIPDEANEYISDYISENLDDIIDELEEGLDSMDYNVKVSINEDTYLEDILNFTVDFINEYCGEDVLTLTIK